jgi:hypothetical protein
VGGADDGALLRSGNDGVSWSVEVADAGSVYAVTTDALGTPWAGGRAGLGTRAASGDWAWWPTSSSWPVSLATGRDFVSVLLDSAEGLRCTSPSSCLTVASGYPGGLEATTASGDVAWFVGGQGAIFQVTSDGGRQLNDTREATVRDLFVEADGGAWAAVTLDSSHGEVWRRTLAGWQVEATLPSEVSSVARVSGTLVVGTAEGVWQQLPNGQFHVSNMPGGAGFILKVRPVGAGGLAVGSVTLSLDGGAWVLERPADWVPGMVLRDVLAFDDGSALVVGRDGDSRGLVLSRSAAGVTVVVDAGIPLAAELMAATRLADGGVFACGYAGFSVEGSSQGGFRALAHDVLTSCNGAWAAPDDSLYVTTPAGVQRVVHGPLNPNQLETTGDYRLNDTLCLPIVPFGDRLLVGGAWASIFTLKP